MKCYLCGGANLKTIGKKLRYNIDRDILKCKDCEIVYLAPQAKEWQVYFENDYRKLYSPVYGKEISSREIFDLSLPYQESRINAINDILNKDMRVLDIGASAGHFLYAIKDRVKECIALEYNKQDSKFMREELALQVYSTPLEQTDLEPESFDLITAYHLLEHIDQPIDFLKSVNRYLKPDGFLVIEVVNVNDPLLSLYNLEKFKEFWFKEIQFFYYSPKTLSLTLEKAGFSSSINSFQSYSFFNHMNWVFNGSPQESYTAGVSNFIVEDSGLVDPSIRNKFNDWFKKINEEYKNLVTENNLGEYIFAIAQKKQ